jgi:glycosyltransferase involved in cell wall biosynthesis
MRSNELQKENPHPLEFDFKEIEFKFKFYRDEIKTIKPDVVLIFLHLKDRIIWPLVHWLKLKKIPVIFWTKGLNLDATDNKLSYMMYQYMHSIFDRLILYSEHEIKYIKEKHHHKISFANNTINFEDFPVINESKEQIKEELSIPFEKVVLSVGRLGMAGGRKKINHLIEVFNDIQMKGVGLVIVGSGMIDEWLQKMNKDNTMYLGEIYDPHHVQISKIFKMADIFSLPGHVGLGLNQAFYWGLPVVTEDGLQPPEIYYLIHGRNGFIVPNNDLIDLKNKILYLLENDDVRQEFSKNARNDILKNASVSNMFMGFKNCVDSLYI